MTNKYKFRAQMLPGKGWCYGLPVESPSGWTMYWIEDGITHTADIDSGTLGQCTECEAENKQMIYESDEPHVIYKHKKWRVRYNEDVAGYELYRQAYGDGENDTVKLNCDVAYESIVINDEI